MKLDSMIAPYVKKRNNRRAYIGPEGEKKKFFFFSPSPNIFCQQKKKGSLRGVHSKQDMTHKVKVRSLHTSAGPTRQARLEWFIAGTPQRAPQDPRSKKITIAKKNNFYFWRRLPNVKPEFLTNALERGKRAPQAAEPREGVWLVTRKYYRTMMTSKARWHPLGELKALRRKNCSFAKRSK
jgi:hypothetical protein